MSHIHPKHETPTIHLTKYIKGQQVHLKNSITNKASTSSISQTSKHNLMTSTMHIHHVHQPYHAHHRTYASMHVHVHIVHRSKI